MQRSPVLALLLALLPCLVGLAARQAPGAPTLAPSMPLAASVHLREPAYLRASPAFRATRLALVPKDATGAIDAWTTDNYGAAWYHTTVMTRTGWIYGDAATFDRVPPAQGAALLDPMRATGMWCTYDLLRRLSVADIVTAAQAAHLSHLYVEVARTNKGFYGGPGLAALLPAAHAAGLKVMAWVYPFLANLPFDIAMSAAAATFTAPSGDRPDGLLADVEETTAEPAVRAYGQILRAMLGPSMLMAIATYPPQWAYGRHYPFATAALSWDAIVPMDYWRLRRRPYSAAEVYQFIKASVDQIRARTRPDEPVEVLGQMFDIVHPYRMAGGAGSPTGAEIKGCIDAAWDSGALGVSFFEWSHATPQEWNVLARSRWPVASGQWSAVHLRHSRERPDKPL